MEREYVIESRTLELQDTAVEFATLKVDEIRPFLERAFGEVAAYLERKGAGPAGVPFARYDHAGDAFEVEAGYVATSPVSGEGDVEPSELPAGLAAVTVHTGTYDEMEPAYAALHAWIRDQGGEPSSPPWEVYLTDPRVEPDPAAWRTEIVQPYRPA
jgi:effector-binding domain-containing protein